MSANKNPISKKRDQLASAGHKVPVQFTSSFEQGSTIGYVMDIGPEFFLIALVDELVRFNGFQCLRLQDVRRLQVPAKYAAFLETALGKRNERIPKKPRVKLDSVQELLQTASDAFPVITIFREKIASDVCHIGRLVGVNRDHVSLLEIGPDACWEDEATHYRTREITRVDFGGAYEEALILVGGLPE